MHVSIAIVAFRNADEIAGCLSALSASTYPDFDVVICENGGPEAFEALSAVTPDTLPGGQAVRAILAPGNLGYAGGVNVCMTASPDADAWWIVNPDTVPAPGALAALVARLQLGDVAAVGGVLHNPQGRIQAYGGQWRAAWARPVSIGNGASLSEHPDPAEVERRTNYLLGASMLIGREFVDRVGLMREDYFLYCEEVEWCLRAVAAGLKLGFAPDALVCHDQGGSTGSGDAHRKRPRLPIYLDERNKLNVVRDTTPGKLPLAALGSLMLLFARYGRRGAFRQLGYGLSGWLAGLRNRRGLPPWMA
ncbi:glycosyltransferase family 2 protein [Novosphingobium mangrovi (ex Huang et al. 2023)]|uniref:Glycosyltransferase family 2 protein n=1 Tax=Novosphingobium mangrovi (ex Huang et al. 2023) TaxID=2976432 RepID=A0ABT2I0S2_9SPHN|nr:glycosyltransferase family 2 protein [Novosphingobium mangrovi (ex Huang et al. 2023)]MCT2398405.1 glycosyltransferase family 2 protein [Novosphingobium mangrovi (ex Huang et al. 2023)]